MRLGRALFTLALLTACGSARAPLRTTTWTAGDRSTAVVCLPGIGATDQSFLSHGIVRTVRHAGVRSDVVGVRANLAHYVDGAIVDRVRAELLPDLRARYDHVALLGISLGGLGALEVAAAEPDAFDEVLLLSPFVGRGQVKRSIQSEGGIRTWTAPERPDWDEAFWARLQPMTRVEGRLPPMWLGYGRKDPIVGEPTPLAAWLPPERVLVEDGGHRWKIWRTLLGRMIDRGALGGGTTAAR